MAEQVKTLTLVEQNKKQIVNIVQSEGFKTQLAAALMNRLPQDYVIRSAIAMVNSSPRIQECTPLSIASSILLLAQAGLAPEPWKGHGYLVPRNIKVTKKGQPDRWEMTCTALIGYRGYLNLAYKSPLVSKPIAHVVYEGDIFDLDQVAGTVTHKPWIRSETGREKRGEILGAYALVKMKSGESLVEWMTKEDIDATRKRSASSDKGPWDTDYAEMSRKTPFRRLFKWIPDPDLQHIASLEEASELGNISVTIDGQTGEIITQAIDPSEQTSQLPAAIQMPQRLQNANNATSPIVTQQDKQQQKPAVIEAEPVKETVQVAAEKPQETVTETEAIYEDEPDDDKPKDYGFGSPPVGESGPITDTDTVLPSDLFASKEEERPLGKTIGPGQEKRIYAIANTQKTRTKEDFEEFKRAFKIEHIRDLPSERLNDALAWVKRPRE